MLLQSQGGMIRLFPCWPRDKSASFRKLGARGGFVVSSQWLGEAGLGTTTIASRAGGRCRLRSNDVALPVVRSDDATVSVHRDGRDVWFETVGGTEYVVTPQSTV